MLVILEIEPALVGGGAPVFVDEVGARIDEPLGLRHLDAVEAVLDRKPLGDAELIAGRLRRRRRHVAGAGHAALVEEARQLMQKHDREQRVTGVARVKHALHQFVRRLEGDERNVRLAQRRRTHLELALDHDARQPERALELVERRAVGVIRQRAQFALVVHVSERDHMRREIAGTVERGFLGVANRNRTDGRLADLGLERDFDAMRLQPHVELLEPTAGLHPHHPAALGVAFEPEHVEDDIERLVDGYCRA